MLLCFISANSVWLQCCTLHCRVFSASVRLLTLNFFSTVKTRGRLQRSKLKMGKQKHITSITMEKQSVERCVCYVCCYLIISLLLCQRVTIKIYEKLYIHFLDISTSQKVELNTGTYLISLLYQLMCWKSPVFQRISPAKTDMR